MPEKIQIACKNCGYQGDAKLNQVKTAYECPGCGTNYDQAGNPLD
jgi:predicted Zn-ribbon and HTH transcriptional regulator